MKQKTIVGEVRRTQILNLTIFGLLAFLLITLFSWNQFLSAVKYRLLEIDKVLGAMIQNQRSSITGYLQSGDKDKIHPPIFPAVYHQILLGYPTTFTLGFYLPDLDWVIIERDHRRVNLKKNIGAPFDEPEKKYWLSTRASGTSAYEFFWSRVNKTWVFGCGYSINFNRHQAGYTFAFITLSNLIRLYATIGSGIFAIVIGICLFCLLLLKRFNRNICRNTAQLMLLNSNPQFDFIEFQKIAFEFWLNHQRRQSMLANLPWGYLLIQPSGKIVDINDNGLSLIGLNREQVIGADIQKLCPKTSVVKVIETKALVSEETLFSSPPGESKRYFTYSFPMILPSGEEGAMIWILDRIEQAKAQKIIEESTVKIGNILESISEAFFALDQDWRFTYMNQAAEDVLFGKKKEELIGKSVFSAFPTNICSNHYSKFNQVMNERTAACFEIPYADNGTWIEVRAYPAIDGISVFVRDITERKWVEKTTQQLAAIVETSEDAIFSMTLEGKISSWNYGAQKLYGYTAEEAIGKMFLLIIPEDSRASVERTFQKLTRGQLFEDNHTSRVRKDGSIIYVSIKYSLIQDASGNIVEISSIHRDITERIQYEEALAKERELLMVTLNSLTEGVIATDGQDRIFLINEAASHLTGYSQTEAINQPIDEILYIIDDKTSEPITRITSFSTSQNHKLAQSLILVTRNLNEVLISVHSSPIKTSTDIIGAVIVFQDISEKFKIEHELFKTDKLESLGILAGGIAHDFNNILAALLSNIQLAQMKYNRKEDIKKYLQDMVESTHRASDLTRQLLTFSRGGAPVKKAASLGELIGDTAEFALRGSKVKVSCEILKSLWPVEVDTGQISQVIYNLVINAKQAMPRGGAIKITAENMVNDSGNRFDPGNYIKIAVKDQGVGIPKENLGKIFDPFFTTKKEGSGLGLSTSYSIIKRHDGYLEVESEVGLGTTFWVYLPALNQAVILPEGDKEIEVTGGPLKILLMDDEEIILNSVAEMLELYGHQTMSARDGAKAIEIYCHALEEGTPFDVVIMDLTVPGGMGGQEAISQLRNIDPHIRAVVSSGYANDPIISNFERFGFSGVVIKPYRFDELIKVINQVVQSKQLPLKLDF